MILFRFFKLALGFLDIRKKRFLALFILMILPALFTYNFVVEVVVRDVNVRYSEDFFIRGDIEVAYNYYNFGGSWAIAVFNITDTIRSIDGVKWAYSPSSIRFFNLSDPQSSVFYEFIWCNVSDPTFPKPEYVVEGEFFSSNFEDAVLLDRLAFLYFTQIGLISGIGDTLKLTYIADYENGSSVSVTFQWRVKGIVSSPAMDSISSFLISGSNYKGQIILPIGTFQEFFEEGIDVFYFRNGVIVGPLEVRPSIIVRVKPGYDVFEVAERIKEVIKGRFPGEIKCFIWEDFFNKYRERVIRDWLIYSIATFSLIAAILFWDIGDKRRLISLLRVMGWRRRHVVSLFVLRYLLIGFIGSLVSNIAIILILLFSFIPVLYFWFLFVHYYIYVLGIYLGLTLISSIPAMARAYGLDLEKALRH